MEQQGIITSVLQWFTHPKYSEGTLKDYGAAVLFLLAVSFLWSKVVEKL